MVSGHARNTELGNVPLPPWLQTTAPHPLGPTRSLRGSARFCEVFPLPDPGTIARSCRSCQPAPIRGTTAALSPRRQWPAEDSRPIVEHQCTNPHNLGCAKFRSLRHGVANFGRPRSLRHGVQNARARCTSTRRTLSAHSDDTSRKHNVETLPPFAPTRYAIHSVRQSLLGTQLHCRSPRIPSMIMSSWFSVC